VDKWIGGIPTAGETVTVRTCDEYQVEGEYRTQRVLQIGPTPTESDTIGSESICVLYYALPKLPLDDDDAIEMDERYKPPLLKALEWKAAERWGKEFNYVMNLESVYKATANNYRGDLNRPDLRQPLTVSGNRSIATRYGLKNQVPSGIRYDI
jgi:hypothetical protein